MININDINTIELFEMEAISILKKQNELDPLLVFTFGRSFVYGANVLNVHFNNPKELNHSERKAVPALVKCFESVGFNLSLFTMEKNEICDLLGIEHYSINYSSS